MDSMISQTKSRAAKEVVNDDWKFQVNLDVRQFSPEEVNVKTSNNEIFVEAKHEEKADEHGFIQRSFSRRYVLPSVNFFKVGNRQFSKFEILEIRVSYKT
jgi:HSP20 family molecular chaperone IbpA